ncbi:MAG: serine acetyltransferase [Phycisphaeraceae bacterium]
MSDEAKQRANTELIAELADRLVGSYGPQDHLQHINQAFLPRRARIIEFIELLRKIVFPGFFDEEPVTPDNVRDYISELLARVQAVLHEQVLQAICYKRNIGKGTAEPAGDDCRQHARDITAQFLKTIPELRRKLALDVEAAFEGDPAASSTDEAIFSYPGIDAIFIQRAAHELFKLKVPLIPRIMTEIAHSETGIDIHPGAVIGDSFFIDHGTGVVIGETTVIGNNVKIYQGVTLGALSTKGGQAWRGMKRHPTIEDNVTIYPNATILGGETVIGAGCVINGGVFLTHSVEPGHTVRIDHPQPQLRAQRKRSKDTPQQARQDATKS